MPETIDYIFLLLLMPANCESIGSRWNRSSPRWSVTSIGNGRNRRSSGWPDTYLNFSVTRTETVDTLKEVERPRRNKTRRYTYEDTHQWPADDSVEYDFDDAESKEVSMWEKVGQNWQVVGLRMIFIFSALCVAMMLCCCCCQIALRACCFNLKEGCKPCGPLVDIISSFYEDPMYKKAKKTAKLFGLKLDYKTYMKVKETHSTEVQGGCNPLGLPWMEV
ncbi:hypothetical protein Btru_066948 [Bulinus truncatus]|nr:hypothetical protein Btru_066948 [Bulinus truncatus]